MKEKTYAPKEMFDTTPTEEKQQNDASRNVFISSLETLTQDDLGAPQKAKKGDIIDTAISVIRRIIFIAALVVFLFSGGQVIYKLIAYEQSKDIYNFDYFFESTRKDIVRLERAERAPLLIPVNGDRTEQPSVTEEETYNELFEMMKGQLAVIQQKNDEVVGWIRVEGETEINYPIVQHTDNDYYLRHAYDGTYNPAGAIYLDYKNLTRMSDNRHAVIYGHNMISGSPMFANLLNYQDESFWANNRYIEIYTRDTLYTYEIFAAYSANPSLVIEENHAWRMNFNYDDAIFLQWIDAIRARSDISTDILLDETARILTLSTCTNYDYNRYVVHAVLVNVEK